MSFDDLIEKLNENKKFKIIVFLLLALPSFQNYSQLQNALVALYTPKFQCVANGKVESNQCNYKSSDNSQHKCTNWTFSDQPFGKTQISEFNLVCDKAFFSNLLLLSWYSTSLISPFIGILSDKFGRKYIALANLLLETFTTILLAFAPDLISTFLARILLGISGCDIFICFVWLMEMVDENFRTFAGSFYWLYGCLAYTTFPLIVYYTRNWRYTQLISVIPNIFYIFIFFIPESPRWLLTVNRKVDAIIEIEKIKKINNLNHIKYTDENLVVKMEKVGKIKRIIKSKIFLERTVISFLMQFSTFIYWSAVTVDLTILSFNQYLTIFLMGLMETPSVFLTFIGLNKLHRKKCILIFGGIGSSLFLVTVFLNQNVAWQLSLRITIGCIAKICVATVLQTSMVYFIELFPTSHRSFSLIFIQIANFLSFVCAVYINKLRYVIFFLPMLVYFVMFWSSYFLVEFKLPETKDLPMPEHMRDIEQLIRGKEHEFIKYFNEERCRNMSSSSSSNHPIDDRKLSENIPLLTSTDDK